MPMPVSATSKRTPSWPSGAASGVRRSSTVPAGVNLIALPTRLSRTCLRRSASTRTWSGACGAISSSSASPRACALARSSAVTEAASACSDVTAGLRVSLPASILAWSRTSLMIAISVSPDPRAVLTSRRCWPSSALRRSRSSAPSTPFIGVRISWLIVARNCDLARLAASAVSLALRSEACAASASSRWPIASAATRRNSVAARCIVRPYSRTRIASAQAPSPLPMTVTRKTDPTSGTASST